MMNNEQLISIIVPVYKVEPYLRKCVDSILAQTYQNFELILVDDGSPDNCPAICDEYATRDPRIRVIHKENGDVSTARNAGLDICRGEYITFIDSDDWVEPRYVEALYDAIIAYNADFSQCNLRTIKLDGSCPILREQDKDLIFNRHDAIDSLMADSWKNGINVLVWGKLYKRKCFENLRFQKGRYHEDDIAICDVVTAQSFSCAVVIKEVLVNYLEREICRSKVVTSKELVDRYYCALHMYKRIPSDCRIGRAYKSAEIFRRVMEIALCGSDMVLPVFVVLKERPDMADILKEMVWTVSVHQVRAAGGTWRSVLFWLVMRANLRLGLFIRSKM